MLYVDNFQKNEWMNEWMNENVFMAGKSFNTKHCVLTAIGWQVITTSRLCLVLGESADYGRFNLNTTLTSKNSLNKLLIHILVNVTAPAWSVVFSKIVKHSSAVKCKVVFCYDLIQYLLRYTTKLLSQRFSRGHKTTTTTQRSQVQKDTIQLHCLYVEKFAFWLVIYIKHSIHFTIKHKQADENRNLHLQFWRLKSGTRTGKENASADSKTKCVANSSPATHQTLWQHVEFQCSGDENEEAIQPLVDLHVDLNNLATEVVYKKDFMKKIK